MGCWNFAEFLLICLGSSFVFVFFNIFLYLCVINVVDNEMYLE